ncbi:MAG: hypothetical protein JXQ90_01645 [Cyclobacteriaceae bacterium]
MLIEHSQGGERLNLYSPTKMPRAAAFLWNECMMIHMNCRGYAVAQFMQPEPSKYAHAPNLEAKTFMQPEQPYYAHHPGRFFYVKDHKTGDLFSAPYEPCRVSLDKFEFSAGKSDIKWKVCKYDLEILLKLTLTKNDPIEIWSMQVTNLGSKPREISVYPYFPVGYMSWMNQSGRYNKLVNGIITSSITPYQKYKDYFKNKHLKDKTFLIGDHVPDAWEANQEQFEGEGGLSHPAGIQQETLSMGDAIYETPTCAMQYNMELAPGERSEEHKFLFGAAATDQEVQDIRDAYFGKKDQFEKLQEEYDEYISSGKSLIEIESPDESFNLFVNHWLPRQIYYHGVTNRLTTDPQTRNYLQDNMGMSYILPEVTKGAFRIALGQQNVDGSMPDGILIHRDAELKYINEVPHTDHCVWVPICLKAYLDETNDYNLLNEVLPYAGGEIEGTVSEHIHKAMHWLVSNRDHRGLNFIEQGDWCDPMNMVGYKGKGVSGWLTMATSYALKVWSDICEDVGDIAYQSHYKKLREEINQAINAHIWDDEWYGRGITDDGVLFGVKTDKEGSIFLNPQGWAFLSGCSTQNQNRKILKSVEERLESPFGVEIIAPAYTAMRDDVGRVTQKFPGSAENGSIYNHAAAFYVYGLYQIGEANAAFRMLRKMIPGPDQEDILQRGQLPVFIPNYYRGAYRQFPRTAGRSSQLFNTGTAHWVYRCIIDGLLGVQGCPKGLKITPNLPSDWKSVKVIRHFRKSTFDISMEVGGTDEIQIVVDGSILDGSIITNIEPGKKYTVEVVLPIA